MPLVVAMSMKRKEIARNIIVSVPISVVDLYHILICEKQSTPSAPSVLPLQCLGEPSGEEWVCFQSLAPVEQLSIKRTRFTLDFGVSPDVRITVLTQGRSFWGCEDPVVVAPRVPVFAP